MRIPGLVVADRGSASLLVAIWACVIVVAGLAAVSVGSVLHDRVRLASAADLAALAGAAEALGDARSACRRAVTIARANGAAVEGCEVLGTRVRVRVGTDLRVPGWPGRTVHLTARAHAELAARPPPGWIPAGA